MLRCITEILVSSALLFTHSSRAVSVVAQARLDGFQVIPLEKLQRMVGAAAPEQISINYGATVDAFTVNWVTASAGDSTVQYGTSATFGSTVTGTSSSYKFGSYTSGFIHTATITGLNPKTKYYYQCGGASSGWSSTSTFTSNSVGLEFPYTFGVLGDVGQTANSNNTMHHVLSNPTVRSTFITGDISYADSDQPRWDSFQRLASPMTSVLPFMVASGNHEEESTGGVQYVPYNARYNMPFAASFKSSSRNLWYSYETGPVHVIILASFVDFSTSSPQYKWLVSDLAAINRAVTPWVIAMAHAPWQHSNQAHPTDGNAMRKALEPMMVQNKVSAMFFGHVHAYERTCAMANSACAANGIVYVTIGDGGNREGLYTKWVTPQPAWSVFRAAEYGHGLLTILDSKSANWTWVRNSDNEKVASDSTVFKNTWS